MTIAVVCDVPENVRANGALLRARGIVSGLETHGYEASLVRVRGADRRGLYRRHSALSEPAKVPELQDCSGAVLCGIALAHAITSVKRGSVVLDVCDSAVEAWSRRIAGGDVRAVGGFINVLRLVRVARRSACITYVTQPDLDHDRALWWGSGLPVRVMTNGVAPLLQEVQPLDAFRGRLGFVADLSYRSNRLALDWILKKVWPSVAHLGWRLLITGPTPPDVALPSGVTYAGFLPSILDVYAGVDVTLAPSLDGAGFKNKVAESLAACRPVITTPLGARGQGETVGLITEREASGFIAQLHDLTPQKVLALSHSMIGQRQIRSWEHAVDVIAPVLDSAAT